MESIVLKIVVCFIAGIGADVGTGFAGMSAAAAISPILIAFTGAASHFAIGGKPDMLCLVVCVLSTLLWARVAALIANKSKPDTLNRVVGVVLILIGVAIFAVKLL